MTTTLPPPTLMTLERLREIVQLRDSLRSDAEHDIEDKRDIYNALTDLIDALGIALGHGPMPL